MSNWNDQYAQNLKQQMLLAEYLKQMGDSRYGGSLPLGGKSAAPGGGGRIAMREAGLSPRDRPPMFLTVPSAGRATENAVYDTLMNLRESELEDLVRRNQDLLRRR